MGSTFGYCLDAFVSHLSSLEGIQDGSEKGNWGRSWIQRAGAKICPKFYQRRAGVRPLEGLSPSINRLTVYTNVPTPHGSWNARAPSLEMLENSPTRN